MLYHTPQLELKLAPATGRRGYSLENNAEDSLRLKFAALGMAAAVLSMSYLGVPKAGYFLGVTWVAAMVSTVFFPRLKVKTMFTTVAIITVSRELLAVSQRRRSAVPS